MDLETLGSQLNPSQLEAVTYCDGPSLVIAGAGAGKTRVLTYKIAWLLARGMEPWNILALTFTNKAAREMNERIAGLCGGADLRGLWSGTFHSLFARLLRIEHEAAGFPADYTIYDSTDTRSLVKAIVKEMDLDDKFYKPTTVAGRISEAKNHLILPGQYGRDASIARRDEHDGLGKIGEIYRRYQQRLRAASAMDFDDLLLHTFLLLRDHADVRERYKRRFQYVLVDEYQDTNMAQHRILSLLTDPASRICVVGDDAQSIYGFRGADISNILNFKEQYPSARVIKLECNYRSTQCIVEAANSIIGHNKGQIPKKVFSAGAEGERLVLFDGKTDKEEAQKVATRIVRLRRQEVPYDGIALLYRTNAQSRAFEEVFQGAGIPYRVYGGLSFYQRKEVKDVLAYCRLTVNPDDEEAFLRIVNYPTRGIGNTTVQKVQLAAAQAGVGLSAVAAAPAQYGLALGSAPTRKLAAFCAMMESFRELAQTATASEVVKRIVQVSGMAAEFVKDHSQENLSRRENVDELIGSISSQEHDLLEEQGRTVMPLPDFLATVSLLTDADQAEDGTPRVTLMTVHAAKGLEYDAVFVTGMEDELFPNANARLYPKEMEEERRLFYVAVTRAKRFCFLSYAHTRYRYGQFQFCEPSDFLSEIDSHYLKREDGEGMAADFLRGMGGREREAAGKSWESPAFETVYDKPKPAVPTSSRTSFSPYGLKSMGRRPVGGTSAPPSSSVRTAFGTLSIGTRIEHDRFGKGTVVGVEGAGSGAQVRVDFGAAGVKKLLVKFAKFRVL